jgi:hypothetical protein
MNVFWIIFLAISWIFLGFIAMGVLSAILIENFTFAHWQRVKNPMRISAIILGPLIFCFVIAYMIYAVTIATIRDKMPIWALPDWILAGFNEPPMQPRESTLDLPTTSP